jgi:phage shock protein PspC (stress-responsive transcriptional regulator)
MENQMEAQTPTQPQPQPPRRLYRSRTDRLIGGVCGGLGEHFGVDAVIVRIAAVVLLLFGGASALAYLAFLVLVPEEPLEGAPPPPKKDRSSTATIVGIVALVLIGGPILLLAGLTVAAIAVPVAVVALTGLLVWWLVSGEAPGGGAGDVAKRSALGIGVLLLCFAIFVGGFWAAGLGGGTVAAVTVIAAGVVLTVSAFVGGFRLLILPALALALGVGFVSAAGVDLHGGVGQREYKPASAADLHDRYRIGAGQLVVDLRNTELPKGDTPLKMKVGVGDALLLVPRDVCVASKATIGAGGVDVFDRDNGGLDVDFEDLPAAATNGRRVVVDADVGMGAFEVRHYRRGRFDNDRFGHRFNDDEVQELNEGCASA